MPTLSGVIAAAATPVRDDLSIDLDHLVEHCRWLLGDGGCDGINLLGTTGEATSFSAGQRVEAMRAVAKSGLPLDRFMVGTGAAALDDSCTLTAEAKSLGFAGALLLPPFYYKGLDAEGVVAYVEALIGKVGAQGLKLYLYHFPANSAVPYTPEIVARLRNAHPDQVLGLKDSSGDLDYSAGLARDLPGFAVFPSAEASLGRAAELGFAGCISATANVTGPYAQIAWSGSDAAAKKEALDNAVTIRAIIASFPLVASVKSALALLTGREDWAKVMPPLTELSERQKAKLADALSTSTLGKVADFSGKRQAVV
ncbi:MAG: dihydrodipicolinate synthase family protein [Rhizobiales bacterium]|nr:dihydrodipicolinate synthase family protein [Hyphomicrobiales bacterium]